jgi:hypothetical protein
VRRVKHHRDKRYAQGMIKASIVDIFHPYARTAKHSMPARLDFITTLCTTKLTAAAGR